MICLSELSHSQLRRLLLDFFANHRPEISPRLIVKGRRRRFQLIRRFIERVVSRYKALPRSLIAENEFLDLFEADIRNFFRAIAPVGFVREVIPVLRFLFLIDHFYMIYPQPSEPGVINLFSEFQDLDRALQDDDKNNVSTIRSGLFEFSQFTKTPAIITPKLIITPLEVKIMLARIWVKSLKGRKCFIGF
jgi:hypothetical protein